jgi:C4-dicarboxylate transporter DctM subunit
MLVSLLLSFFVLLLIGTPIAFAIGLSSLFALLLDGRTPLTVVVTRMFTAVDSYPIMAIPFFVLAGELMNTAGITKRLVNFANALVGHMKGGLAQVNIVASMLFAGLSGSAAADASSIGAMLIPAMIEDGYKKDFAVAITATSSCIGPIIPPSILMVVFGSIAGVSIGGMFLGGIIPGLLVGFGLMIAVSIYSSRYHSGKKPRKTFGEIFSAFKEAVLALITPAIILGGIVFGAFTPTEAGAIAVVYSFIIGVFVFKEINIPNFKKALYSATTTTAICMLVVATASIFGWILTREQFPVHLTKFLLSISSNPTVIYILIVAMLLIIGLFIEILAAAIILVPVLFPVAVQFGFDPIHFGVVVVVALIIGAVTPPVGVLLFITCSIARTTIKEVTKILIPFVGVLVAVLFLITLIPGLVTFLPNLILYNK